MEGTVLMYFITFVNLIFYAAIACVLVPKFRRTRDPGLLWLCIALAVWPLISRGFNFVTRSLIQRGYQEESADFFPFSLFSSSETPFHVVLAEFQTYSMLSQMLISQILVLTAVALLYRAKREASAAV